jgi:DNA-binding NarL/FixJ family response regulator
MKTRFDVDNVATLAELGHVLETNTFDIIFVDYALPDGTGLDALELIRLSPRNCNAATILITGMDHEDIAIAAMDAGCSDYISKEMLTKTAFKRAVTNAFHDSVTSGAPQAGPISAALHHFARDCAQDLKPMVSRMLRQTRDLRLSGPDRIADQADAVEKSCNQIWHYLVALQEQEGHPAIRSAQQRQIKETAAKGGRPPSPFRRHS